MSTHVVSGLAVTEAGEAWVDAERELARVALEEDYTKWRAALDARTAAQVAFYAAVRALEAAAR